MSSGKNMIQTILLSICCGAIESGELSENGGRCSSCLEMSSFEESGV